MAGRGMALPRPIWAKQAEEAKLKDEEQKAAAARVAFDATFKDVDATAETLTTKEEQDEAEEANSDCETDDSDKSSNKPIGPVDPSKCTAAGTGVAGGAANAAASFAIVTKDSNGQKVPHGGSQIKVKIIPGPDVGGPEQEGIVKDHGDGTYTVTYAVAKRGNYTVSVECNGAPILNSPFPVFFSAGTGVMLPNTLSSSPPAILGASPYAASNTQIPYAGLFQGSLPMMPGLLPGASCTMGGQLGHMPLAPSAAAMAAAQSIMMAQAYQAAHARAAAQEQTALKEKERESAALSDEKQKEVLAKTLQVTNLSPLLTSDQVKTLFSFCGTVCSCHVTETKQLAYIEYSKPEEAKEALKLNNMEVGGRHINVEMAKSFPPKKTPSSIVAPPVNGLLSTALPAVMQQAVALQQLQFQQALALQQVAASQQAAMQAATLKSASEMAAARAAEISKSLKASGSEQAEKEATERSPSCSRRSKSKSPVRHQREHRSRSMSRSPVRYRHDRRDRRDRRDPSHSREHFHYAVDNRDRSRYHRSRGDYYRSHSRYYRDWDRESEYGRKRSRRSTSRSPRRSPRSHRDVSQLSPNRSPRNHKEPKSLSSKPRNDEPCSPGKNNEQRSPWSYKKGKPSYEEPKSPLDHIEDDLPVTKTQNEESKAARRHREFSHGLERLPVEEASISRSQKHDSPKHRAYEPKCSKRDELRFSEELKYVRNEESRSHEESKYSRKDEKSITESKYSRTEQRTPEEEPKYSVKEPRSLEDPKYSRKQEPKSYEERKYSRKNEQRSPEETKYCRTELTSGKEPKYSRKEPRSHDEPSSSRKETRYPEGLKSSRKESIYCEDSKYSRKEPSSAEELKHTKMEPRSPKRNKEVDDSSLQCWKESSFLKHHKEDSEANYKEKPRKEDTESHKDQRGNLPRKNADSKSVVGSPKNEQLRTSRNTMYEGPRSDKLSSPLSPKILDDEGPVDHFHSVDATKWVEEELPSEEPVNQALEDHYEIEEEYKEKRSGRKHHGRDDSDKHEKRRKKHKHRHAHSSDDTGRENGVESEEAYKGKKKHKKRSRRRSGSPSLSGSANH